MIDEQCNLVQSISGASQMSSCSVMQGNVGHAAVSCGRVSGCGAGQTVQIGRNFTGVFQPIRSPWASTHHRQHRQHHPRATTLRHGQSRFSHAVALSNSTSSSLLAWSCARTQRCRCRSVCAQADALSSTKHRRLLAFFTCHLSQSLTTSRLCHEPSFQNEHQQSHHKL